MDIADLLIADVTIAEMPSYPTLAITSLCAAVIFIVIRLTCGGKSRKPVLPPPRYTVLQDEDNIDGAGVELDPYHPDNDRESRRQATSLTSRKQTTNNNTRESASTSSGQTTLAESNMGDRVSTEEPPSEDEGTADASGDNVGTPDDVTAAEGISGGSSAEAPPDDGGGEDGGATAAPPDDLSAPPSQVMRRNVSGSNRSKKSNSSHDEPVDVPRDDVPKRHGGIFEFDTAEDSDDDSDGDSEPGSDSPGQTASRPTTTESTQKDDIIMDDDESSLHKQTDLPPHQALKSPRTVSKALLADERGPRTSTPVKHGSEISPPLVESTHTQDLQTQASDTDEHFGLNHPNQDSSVDKNDVSSINVCPQECQEKIVADHSVPCATVTTDNSETATEPTEEPSQSALDTFIVHSNIDSMVKLEEESHPSPSQSGLSMDVITADLKNVPEKQVSPEPITSPDTTKTGQRYKEYAGYLLQRYESEVKQRERSEDWCEFLTSELDAHINARILAETKYTSLLQRTKVLWRRYRRLRDQCAALEDSQTTSGEEGVTKTDKSDSQLLEGVFDGDLDSDKLFSGLEEAKAVWQDQFNTSTSSTTSQDVLSFYDFSALSDSYSDDGRLLAEYDQQVAAQEVKDTRQGAETPEKCRSAAHSDEEASRNALAAEVCLKTTNEETQRSASDSTVSDRHNSWPSRGEELGEKEVICNTCDEGRSKVTDTVDQGARDDTNDDMDPDGGGARAPLVHITLAKSIQDKTAMWEEKLSGRSQLRENAENSDSEQDLLSISGCSGSIRDHRDRLEEKLLGRGSDGSASSSRCELSDQMLGSIQKAKTLWEDRLSVSPPGSTHGSRRLSFDSEDDDDNNNKQRMLDLHPSLSSEMLGSVQQTKRLWQEMESNAGGSHSFQSSRKMSMDGDDVQQTATSSTVSRMPEALTQASEVNVLQTCQQWEEKANGANDKAPSGDSDKDETDKGLCFYVEDELENDASNDHLSDSVFSGSIGNVSNTKKMWEQVLREENDEEEKHDMETVAPERTLNARERRFSVLKKKWEGEPTEDS